MSTKFTTSPVANSWPEPLTVLLQAASQSILRDLLARLRARGYPKVTDSHLILFGNLDCGATHAAQIAQRMRVSRQAISKTLRELQSLDLVRMEDDPQRRNQKLVVMTALGMQFATDARGALNDVEAVLADHFGREAVNQLRKSLEQCWGRGQSSHR